MAVMRNPPASSTRPDTILRDGRVPQAHHVRGHRPRRRGHDSVRMVIGAITLVEAVRRIEARDNALKNVNEFYVLDLLRDKTKLAFKKIFSLSYPDYTTDISILAEPASATAGELPGSSAPRGNPSAPDKQG